MRSRWRAATSPSERGTRRPQHRLASLRSAGRICRFGDPHRHRGRGWQVGSHPVSSGPASPGVDRHAAFAGRRSPDAAGVRVRAGAPHRDPGRTGRALARRAATKGARAHQSPDVPADRRPLGRMPTRSSGRCSSAFPPPGSTRSGSGHTSTIGAMTAGRSRRTIRRCFPSRCSRVAGRSPTDGRVTAALASLEPRLDEIARTTFDLDGVELGPVFGMMLGATVRTLVRSELRATMRIERLLAEIRPAVVVLAQEGIRTAWLAATRRADIPVLAVQHGVLYEGHPGYPHQRHPAHLRLTVTCVYGSWERDVLIRRGAYLEQEVAVTGSPRLDLDASAGPADRASERTTLRAELGIGDDERLLVLDRQSPIRPRFALRAWPCQDAERPVARRASRVQAASRRIR